MQKALVEFWATHGDAICAFLAFVGTLMFNGAVSRYGGFAPLVARLEVLPFVGPILIAIRHLGPNPADLLADLNVRANKIAAAKAARYGFPPLPNAPYVGGAAAVASHGRDLTQAELERAMRSLPTWQSVVAAPIRPYPDEDEHLRVTKNITPPSRLGGPRPRHPSYDHDPDDTAVENVSDVIARSERSRRGRQ